MIMLSNSSSSLKAEEKLRQMAVNHKILADIGSLPILLWLLLGTGYFEVELLSNTPESLPSYFSQLPVN